MSEVRKGLWFNSNFMKLWIGKTVSDVGNGITDIALPLTAVIVLSATSAQVAILTALGSASVLVFSLFAGVWVDRLPRRTVLIATDIGRALLLASIPVAALTGTLHIEQLYIVGTLVGLLTVFFNVADQSFLPALIQQHDLIDGNSKLGASSSIAEISGPTLAGILVSLITAPLAILFDALSFLASALCMSLIHTSKQVLPKIEPPQHIWHDIVTGLRVVIDDPILRILALSGSIFEFFGNFIGTLYILYIVRVLHANPIVVGFLVATGGISALIGAFVAGRIVRRFRLGRTIGWALLGYGLVGLLIPLAQGPTSIAISILFVAQFVGDILVEIYLISEISLRQGIVPSHLLGRANASMQFFTRGVGPIGALVAGFGIVPLIGIRNTLLIGVLGVILAGLCLLFSPIHKIEKIVTKV